MQKTNVSSALLSPEMQIQLSEIQTLKSGPSKQYAVANANESRDLAVLTPAEGSLAPCSRTNPPRQHQESDQPDLQWFFVTSLGRQPPCSACCLKHLATTFSHGLLFPRPKPKYCLLLACLYVMVLAWKKKSLSLCGCFLQSPA